jgi:hypothetical protein
MVLQTHTHCRCGKRLHYTAHAMRRVSFGRQPRCRTRKINNILLRNVDSVEHANTSF